MTSFFTTQTLIAFFISTSSPAHANGDVFPPPKQNTLTEMDTTGLPESAISRPTMSNGVPHHVEVRLLSDHQQVSEGNTIQLGIWLEQDEEWHTYWKSPGSIGKPTVINWSLELGSGETAEDINAEVSAHKYPIPSKFDQSGIVSYGYEDSVLLVSSVTLPNELNSDQLYVKADVEWLVCKESCIPGETSVSLPISIGESPVPSVQAPLFTEIQKQHPSHPLDIKEFALESVTSVDAIVPDSTFSYAIKVTPTSDKPLSFDEKKDWPLFTPITGDWWWINEQRLIRTEDGGLLIQIDGESFESEELPTTDRIGGLIQLQVDDSWISVEIESDLSMVAKESPVNKIASPLLESTPQNNVTTDTDKAPEASAEITETEAPEEASMLEALLLAFFGGMLLNIMPCVLPVLSLKLFSLIEQSDITPREQKIAGLSYSGGIIASFLVLALSVIILQSTFGLNVGWGFQFQYPGYVIGLATIVFVFGLSLLGVFEIPAIGANKANELSQKEGWLEYFMIGVFATLLATPCSAPFLGTGIGFAFTLPPAGILLFFAIAGLGLASPFLLVAFVPAFFKVLPQPGAWMETFKQIMGFTLLATTVWLIDVLGSQTGMAGVTGFLSFLTVVSISAWIFGTWGSVIATSKSQLTSFLIAIALSTGAGFFFLTTEFAEPAIAAELTEQSDMDFSEDIPWQPFSDENIDALKADKKAIFIDFTADWCLSCKVNEKNVLETETIRMAMKDQGIVPVKADWTRRDDSISRWLKEYGKAGVPFYLFIDAKGVAHPLPEVLTTGIVLDAFKK